jgi:hypothetical protein
VHQLFTHRDLIQDESRTSLHRWAARPVDALVVPAHREARMLRPVIELAAASGTQLLILASHACRSPEIARLVAAYPGCRALVARIPAGYRNDALDFRTASAHFRRPNAGRTTDLSLKRNIGLLLARMLGWNKIMFFDDDITGVSPWHLVKVAAQLDRHQVTGLVCRQFPDNSVVCHANRLRGAPQENFVTGGALGVNCADQPLELFPDIYNEDWFFFADHAAAADVVSVGEARQARFNPFRHPGRATTEEFGDLLAEGIYALFSEGLGLSRATRPYWREFIPARRTLIETIMRDLRRVDSPDAVLARRSLHQSRAQLGRITPDDCCDFLDAWQHDRRAFARTAAHLSSVRSEREAFGFLGLDWHPLGLAAA